MEKQNHIFDELTVIFSQERLDGYLSHTHCNNSKNEALIAYSWNIKSQTPETNHEESWWKLVIIAYAQLYLSRDLARNMPKPWEKYLSEFKSSDREIAPSQVQNDFGRIIREIGTPAKPPKPRNISKGRRMGDVQIKRKPHPVIIKKKISHSVAINM